MKDRSRKGTVFLWEGEKSEEGCDGSLRNPPPIGTDRSALCAPAILRHSQLSHFSSKTASLLMRGPVNHQTGRAAGDLTVRGFLPWRSYTLRQASETLSVFFENIKHF